MIGLLLLCSLTLLAWAAYLDSVNDTCTFEHCPVCLQKELLNSSRNLEIPMGNVISSAPLRIGRCLEYWDTQAIHAQITGIMAKELLGINVEYVHAEDESIFFRALNNCVNWMDGKCVKVVRSEQQASDAYQAGSKLCNDALPDVFWVPEMIIEDCCQEDMFEDTDIVWFTKQVEGIGDMKFLSTVDIYFYHDNSEVAWQQHGWVLTDFVSYQGNASQISKDYFSSVQEVVDLIASEELEHEHVGCTSTTHASLFQTLVQWGYRCIDGWWLTPACAEFGLNWTQKCIPLLDDSWGFWKPTPYQLLAEYSLPFAKVTLGYDLFYECVYYRCVNAPFLWWWTDSQFTVLKPAKIWMPETYYKQQVKLASSLAWTPAVGVSPILSFLLRHVSLTNPQIDELMNAVTDAQALDYWSGQEGGPALYQKLACDWLRNHRGIWEEAWLPDPRGCLPGDAYNVTSAICQPCPEGTYAKQNPADGIPRCFACPIGHFCFQRSTMPRRCAPGFFANESGAKECSRCQRGRFNIARAASSCVSCSRFMLNSTSLMAAKHPTECFCPSGTFELPDHKKCVQYVHLGVLVAVSQNPQYHKAVAAFEQDLEKNHDISNGNNASMPLVQIPQLSSSLRVHLHVADTGGKVDVALQELLDFSGLHGNVPVQGIVGAHYSSVSIPVASLAKMLNTVQISPASTSHELSDKEQFPYFLRTIPSNTLFGKAMWAYIVHFEFHACAMVYQADFYGESSYDIIQEASVEAGKSEILQAHRLIPNKGTESAIVNQIKASGLNAILVAVSLEHVKMLIDAFRIGNLWAPHCQLLFSESAQLYAADLAEGSHMMTIHLQTDKAAALRNIIASSVDEFSILRALDLQPSSAFLFDSLYAYVLAFNRLLQQGVEIPDIQGKVLFDALQDVAFDGVSGYVSFNGNGDRLMDGSFMNLRSRNGTQIWENAGVFRTDVNDLSISSQVQWMDGTSSAMVPLHLSGCSAGFSIEGLGRCQRKQQMSEDANSSFSNPIIVSSIVLAIAGSLALGMYAYRRHKRGIHYHDSPSSPKTECGAWTLKWVGPHVHALLSKASVRNVILGSHQASVWRSSLRIGSWCINATPFDIEFLGDSDETLVCLKSMCFTKECTSLSMKVRLHNAGDKIEEENIPNWKRLEKPIILEFEISSQITRIGLPDSAQGNQLGQLKIVCGPHHLVLFVWSPASEIRGMPIGEYKRFLQEVINHPGTWECTDRRDGTKVTVQKAAGDLTRNMYDANKHYVRPTIACLDASYAEARTDFGPADLFISHVWRETARNTLQSIEHIVLTGEWTGHLDRSASSMGHLDSGVRVWFCTCCNNQSRVKEELGSNVHSSAFARVLSAPSCTRVAIISPLLALERKWCVFEFGFAFSANKRVLMLTTEGIVQAGQVTPVTLRTFAKRMDKFSCANATCTSSHDEALIDNAISDMGGITALDHKLKAAFTQAVEAAHSFTSQALDILTGEQAQRTQQPILEWL